MKSRITITGQLGSIQRIKNALLRGNDTSREEGPFMRYVIYHYNSMKDAREALRYAWEELEEYANENHDYCTRDFLSYDAASAEIDLDY